MESKDALNQWIENKQRKANGARVLETPMADGMEERGQPPARNHFIGEPTQELNRQRNVGDGVPPLGCRFCCFNQRL